MTTTATPTAIAPTAPATAETAPAVWDGTNLAGDIVEQGIKKNKAEYQEDLRWWWRYSIEKKFSQAEAAQQLGVDGGTYSKVFRGVYIEPKSGLVLAPPAKMLSRIRVLQEQERANVESRSRGRVMTPTVQEIHHVCRKAWNDGQIAFIYGESHVGKTEAAKWFRDENNHGATLYVDLQGVYGVQDVYRAFARALKISAETPVAKLIPRIMNAIDRTNLVIVDEFHYITYSYQKAGAVRMVNALKAIKDHTLCAMVLISTNVGRDALDETKGHDAQLLKQISRRGVIKLQLPDALRVGDVRAFAEAFGLEFPEPAKDEKGKLVEPELWKGFRAKHEGSFAGLDLCERIAYSFGVKHLVSVIQDGMRVAKKRGRDLTWADVISAQRVYDAMSEKKSA